MDDLLWRGPRDTLLALDRDAVLDRLDTRGAILFRGFDHALEQFVAFSERYAHGFVVHQHSSRAFVSGDGATQTVTSGCDAVPLHRERSYLPVAPDLLFFACVRPSARGGETVLCDGVELAAALPPDVRIAIDGRMRIVTLAPPAEWTRSLATADRREAVARMRSMFVAHRDPDVADLAWDFDGARLRVEFTTPFLRRVAGSPCFANFLLYFLFRDAGFADTLHLTFENGRPIPSELGRAIDAAAEPVARTVHWLAGDVLLVDNRRVMHARRAFDDPAREIHVRMGHALA